MSSGADGGSSFPFKITPVDEETNKKLLEDFKGERTGFVQVGPEKYFFPCKYAKEAENYYNIEVRSDDVWIVTFPRSGTTLTQELVWLIGTDLNYKKAAQIPLPHRFPFLEFGLFFHDDVKEEFLSENSHSVINQKMIENLAKPGWEILPMMESPRFIKTHFPFSLLPKQWAEKKCKTIYVARNPEDVSVSYYHLNRLFRTQGYQGDFSKYWEYFEQNLQAWAPYWSHIKEGLQRENDPNVLFLFYENMVQDMRGTIEKVAAFLNKSLSEEEIIELENHLRFENFRKNESVSFEFAKELKIINSGEQGFIRKGKQTKRKEEFTPDLSMRAEKWIEENMKKISISFPGGKS